MAASTERHSVVAALTGEGATQARLGCGVASMLAQSRQSVCPWDVADRRVVVGGGGGAPVSVCRAVVLGTLVSADCCLLWGGWVPAHV